MSPRTAVLRAHDADAADDDRGHWLQILVALTIWSFIALLLVDVLRHPHRPA